MHVRTAALAALILAAACESIPSSTQPESPELTAAKGGGKPKWIAFETDRTVLRQIWRVKPDATGLQQLTSVGENANPSWSPDGRRIVFTSYRDGGGNGEIYVMNADGGNQQRITSRSAGDNNPDWSPDGSRIVFVSDESGTRDLWRVNPNGTELHPFAGFFDSHEINPKWSPDGNYVAFLSDKNTSGTYNIWVLNVNSGWLNQVTFPGVEPQPLAWTPDSKRVVFVYNFGGNQQNIYGIDVETTQSIILTSSNTLGAPLQYGVGFSPDGGRLVYVALAVGSVYLGSANLDGTDRKVLAQSSNYYGHPAWAR